MHERKYNPARTMEEFEQHNTDYFQEQYIDSKPHMEQTIRDGNFTKYYNDFDWDWCKRIMKELYESFLDGEIEISEDAFKIQCSYRREEKAHVTKVLMNKEPNSHQAGRIINCLLKYVGVEEIIFTPNVE